MVNLAKFFGGLMLGAAIGAGVYVVLTNDSEEGIVYDVKMIIDDAISQGKAAAEARKIELENELRQPIARPEFPDSQY